ncbi:hypothetical protein LWF15_21815 [Kineosporia rhizophila]|uniref:hypothetical protein n=1 Tax=Kineosporia rhizophila TaxID=84633 RepID=UPI001E60AFAE|nr:hypothetical protein [Kineosporia rhizophila]MCE0538137.1 hypothetical protein [Kineosporia rhizophila]
MTVGTGVDPDLVLARQAAETAARAAGVSVREVRSLPEMAGVVTLFNSIWGDSRPPVSVELLRALSKAGSYVSGAYRDGELVGACVGFFHAPAEDALHSHVAGVSSGSVGRNVGFALKQDQRAWVLERGVGAISWTFDPLIGRNAYFNLAKLGAAAVEYLPDFYGPMKDQINGDEDSDRLLVHWRLRGPRAVQAAAGVPVAVSTAGAVVALGRDGAGRPEPGRTNGELSLVAVPTNVTNLRLNNPALAREWRVRVRETLQELLSQGARVTGFDKDGGYVVARESARLEGNNA